MLEQIFIGLVLLFAIIGTIVLPPWPWNKGKKNK